MSGWINVPFPTCYRCPYHLDYPACDIACLDYIEEMILKYKATPDSIAGVERRVHPGRERHPDPAAGVAEAPVRPLPEVRLDPLQRRGPGGHGPLRRVVPHRRLPGRRGRAALARQGHVGRPHPDLLHAGLGPHERAGRRALHRRHVRRLAGRLRRRHQAHRDHEARQGARQRQGDRAHRQGEVRRHEGEVRDRRRRARQGLLPVRRVRRGQGLQDAGARPHARGRLRDGAPRRDPDLRAGVQLVPPDAGAQPAARAVRAGLRHRGRMRRRGEQGARQGGEVRWDTTRRCRSRASRPSSRRRTCAAPTRADGDVAVLGIPWDEGTTSRSGARMGPRALRDVSTFWAFQNGARAVLRRRGRGRSSSAACAGSTAATSCSAPCGPRERYHAAVVERLQPLIEAGLFPVTLGGDHSVTYPVLKAVHEARRGKPFQLVQFDTHIDYWDEEGGQRYTHAQPDHPRPRGGLAGRPHAVRHPRPAHRRRQHRPGAQPRRAHLLVRAGQGHARRTSSSSTSSRAPTPTSPSTSTPSTRRSRRAPARPSPAASPTTRPRPSCWPSARAATSSAWTSSRWRRSTTGPASSRRCTARG